MAERSLLMGYISSWHTLRRCLNATGYHIPDLKAWKSTKGIIEGDRRDHSFVDGYQ